MFTPKVIHQIVGPRVTKLIEHCIDSWRQLLDYDFQIKIWNDEGIGQFLSQRHEFAYPAFANARNHAEAADIARYLIIHTHGGFYVDWDIELVDYEGFLSLYNQNPKGYMLLDPTNKTLASEYFSCIPNDQYLLNMVKDIVRLYNNGMRNTMNTPQYSGPYRMRDSLESYPETSMSIVEVKEVFEYDYREVRAPHQGTITKPLIHYWVHSWVTAH